MSPIELHRGLSDHEGKVELGVHLAEAVVRTSTENKVVLGALFLSIANVITVRIELVGVLIHIGIVQGEVCGGNQHRTLGDSVAVGDGECLLDEVGNHEHRRAVAKELTNNSAGVGERLELVHGEFGIDVTVADLEVFFANSVEDVGTLGSGLEQPGGGTAGGILRGKEKGEDGLRNLIVAKHAEKRRGLLARILALFLSLAPTVRLDHLNNPGIHDASNITTSGHADLALGSALGELSEHHVGSLLAVPSLGVGDDNGEVDELEGGSDEIVVVGDLLDSLIANIVADKSAARDSAHKLAELGHEGDGLAAGFLGDIDEALKVCLVDLLLARQVELEGLAGEETVETLAEVDVSLTVEEDPVVMSEKLVGDIDNTRLDIGRRVKNLAGKISGGGNDDEPGEQRVRLFVYSRGT